MVWVDDALAATELEHLARTLGIEIRREPLPVRSGLCQVRGQWTLFLDSTLSAAEQVEVLVEALSRFDLSGVYLRPAIRQMLEGEDGADSTSDA